MIHAQHLQSLLLAEHQAPHPREEEGMRFWDQRWRKHQAGLSSLQDQGGWVNSQWQGQLGSIADWVAWQCLMLQPGGENVLGSQEQSCGQSQLPELVLLDMLLAPSASDHLGGAACFSLGQGGLQTLHGAQGHADLALQALFPCCRACILCICWASAFFLCS